MNTSTATAGLEEGVAGGAADARVLQPVVKDREPEQAAPGAGAVVEEPARESRRTGKRRARRRPLLLRGGASVLAIALLWGGFTYWRHARVWVGTDNAYLAAHIHQVSFRVAGTVKEVLVDENQSVEAGAVLARLDPADFEVRVQQAQAEAAQAKAKIQQAQSQVTQAEAQLAREQAQATKASRDLERAQQLTQGPSGAISRQEYDQAQAANDAAQAALNAARSGLQSARALETAARAQAQAADALAREAALQLGYTELKAPAAGRVGKKNLESGNRVQPGQALLALVQPDVWVTANFKETQLAHMRPGMPAEVRVDAFPGEVFKARVESLSPASGSEFALLPPDNATGNFTRIVQRIPVKIVFEPASVRSFQNRLAPGMSAVVKVKVR